MGGRIDTKEIRQKGLFMTSSNPREDETKGSRRGQKVLYRVFYMPNKALHYTVLYYCTSVMVCQATCPRFPRLRSF